MRLPRLVKSSAILVGIPVAVVGFREHDLVIRNSQLSDRSPREVLGTPLATDATRWYRLARPVIFFLTPDPEIAHKAVVIAGRFIGAVSLWSDRIHRGLRCLGYRYASIFTGPSVLRRPPAGAETWTRLSQTVNGLHYAVPFGISAGFDKNAHLVDFFSNCRLSLGLAEMGSVSYLPWAGNAKPRLFRLPEDQGIINRMGLNNEGAVEVANRISESRLVMKRNCATKLGINITKTPDATIEGSEAVDDIFKTFSFMRHIDNLSWITLNISCPNTAEGKTFEDPQALGDLLKKLRKDLKKSDPQIWLKLAPLPATAGWEPRIAEMLSVAKQNDVRTLVIANTVPDRLLDLKSDSLVLAERGGLSGPPIFTRSIPLINLAFREGFIVVGVGGVSSAKDAYCLIRNGASLIQLYTAMVYDGPGIFEDLRNGLERLLVIDGLSNVSQAIGKDVVF